MFAGAIIPLARETIQEWLNDKGPRLGAALAFYSALSIYPLLVITLASTSIFLGESSAISELTEKLKDIMGTDSAQVLQIILSHSQSNSGSNITSFINLLILLFGASGVFGELQDSFNTIWNVKPHTHNSWLHMAVDRFFSFAMVLGTGFLLLISLILTTALNLISHYFTSLFSGLLYVFMLLNLLISFTLAVGLFALIFKTLPDADIHWKDVWPAAIFTAIAFGTGKFLIGMYISHSNIITTYGAAGSFVAFLVWIYFSAQILYLGAEFTKVYANHTGRRKK